MKLFHRIARFVTNHFAAEKAPEPAPVQSMDSILPQQVCFFGADGKLHRLNAKVAHPDYGTDYDRIRLHEAGLSVGQLLPVTECSVGDSHTSVRLQGINSNFNSVQFDFQDEQGTQVDIYHVPSFQRHW